MDAWRDTPVMPCGPKVDITCAAGHEPERSDKLRMRRDSGANQTEMALCAGQTLNTDLPQTECDIVGSARFGLI